MATLMKLESKELYVVVLNLAKTLRDEQCLGYRVDTLTSTVQQYTMIQSIAVSVLI